MPHDKAPSRASRCPHKTIAAFDIAPHNVGDSRAPGDDGHPVDLLRRTHATAFSDSTVAFDL